MTFNLSLPVVRPRIPVRRTLFRLSSLVRAVFSKSRGTVSSDWLCSSAGTADKSTTNRRYRLEIALIGRAIGEQLLRQASSVLSVDGVVEHSARQNLRESDMGRLIVEASCSCEHRVTLVRFVEHASGPGVTRVRWESIPSAN